MKKIALLFIASGLLGAPSLARAEGGNISVGVTGGTLGIGPEAAFRIGDRIGIRGNATFLSVSHGFDSDDVDYKGKVKLRSAGVMLDVFPFGGGFRVSAGVRSNGSKARVRAVPTDIVELGDRDYTPAQVGILRGRADTKDIAPALTIGYGGAAREGFVFGVEAGALFQGKVKIRDFTSSGGGVSPADLEAERRNIQDDVDDYKVYPILQLSVAYRF